MKALGYEKIEFDEKEAKTLTPPENAIYAEMILESGDDEKVSARFMENGNTPTAIEGMPLNDLAYLEVKKANLIKFKVIGIQAGITHNLKVQYFG